MNVQSPRLDDGTVGLGDRPGEYLGAMGFKNLPEACDRLVLHAFESKKLAFQYSMGVVRNRARRLVASFGRVVCVLVRSSMWRSR